MSGPPPYVPIVVNNDPEFTIRTFGGIPLVPRDNPQAWQSWLEQLAAAINAWQAKRGLTKGDATP